MDQIQGMVSEWIGWKERVEQLEKENRELKEEIKELEKDNEVLEHNMEVLEGFAQACDFCPMYCNLQDKFTQCDECSNECCPDCKDKEIKECKDCEKRVCSKCRTHTCESCKSVYCEECFFRIAGEVFICPHCSFQTEFSS